MPLPLENDPEAALMASLAVVSVFDCIVANMSAGLPMEDIHLSFHEGQELDYIISGRLRFVYDGKHVEELAAGDVILYDSGRGHGMVAIGGEPCVLLASVMKPQDEKIL